MPRIGQIEREAVVRTETLYRERGIDDMLLRATLPLLQCIRTDPRETG